MHTTVNMVKIKAVHYCIFRFSDTCRQWPGARCTAWERGRRWPPAALGYLLLATPPTTCCHPPAPPSTGWPGAGTLQKSATFCSPAILRRALRKLEFNIVPCQRKFIQRYLLASKIYILSKMGTQGTYIGLVMWFCWFFILFKGPPA